MIFQLDMTRFFTVYVLQGFVGVLFLYLAFKILKRDTKRLNLIFSGFYLSAAAAVFLNFIYAPLTDEFIVLILNSMTNYCFFFAPIFLLVFDLILLKSEKVITTKKQLIIIIGYGVILFFMLLIPGGVTINASTNWKPVWSVPFFIYLIVVMTGIAVGPGLYFSIQIMKKFEDEQLKKKWKFFMIGLIGVFVFTYGILVSNTLNDDTFRTIWSYISFLIVLIFPYLMYYGVGKQIER